MVFVQEYSKWYKFNLDQIQQKLMTKFSNKFKKPCFWPIFLIFGTKQISKKFGSVVQFHIGFWHHAKI